MDIFLLNSILSRVGLYYFLGLAFSLDFRIQKYYDFKLLAWILIVAYFFVIENQINLLNCILLVITVSLIKWLIGRYEVKIFSSRLNLLLVSIATLNIVRNLLIIFYSGRAQSIAINSGSFWSQTWSFWIAVLIASASYFLRPTLLGKRFQALNFNSSLYFSFGYSSNLLELFRSFLIVFLLSLTAFWLVCYRGITPALSINYFLLAIVAYTLSTRLLGRNLLLASLIVVLLDFMLTVMIGSAYKDALLFLLVVPLLLI
ncbi:MAG: hypothetical protein WCK98_07355 [bacterium]